MDNPKIAQFFYKILALRMSVAYHNLSCYILPVTICIASSLSIALCPRRSVL